MQWSLNTGFTVLLSVAQAAQASPLARALSHSPPWRLALSVITMISNYSRTWLYIQLTVDASRTRSVPVTVRSLPTVLRACWQPGHVDTVVVHLWSWVVFTFRLIRPSEDGIPSSCDRITGWPNINQYIGSNEYNHTERRLSCHIIPD